MHLFGLPDVCGEEDNSLGPLTLPSFPALAVVRVEGCCTSRSAASFLDADIDETGAGKDADEGRFLVEDRRFFRRAIEDEPCVWIFADDGGGCPGAPAVPMLLVVVPPPPLLLLMAAAEDANVAAAASVRYRRRRTMMRYCNMQIITNSVQGRSQEDSLDTRPVASPNGQLEVKVSLSPIARQDARVDRRSNERSDDGQYE